MKGLVTYLNLQNKTLGIIHFLIYLIKFLGIFPTLQLIPLFNAFYINLHLTVNYEKNLSKKNS